MNWKQTTMNLMLTWVCGKNSGIMKNLLFRDYDDKLPDFKISPTICCVTPGISFSAWTKILRWNPSGNWVISIVSGQKPCTRII